MARKGKVSRKTKETNINVELNIDGKGKYQIDTGIGFLDHMLEQLSKHSLIDLKVKAKGDTHIDLHHTTEDTGIAIGEALKKAAKKFVGIKRYAHRVIPMDETLTRVAIDVSNRPYLIWKVKLKVEKLGEMDTELFKEWFQAFSQAAGITLHMENIYRRKELELEVQKLIDAGRSKQDIETYIKNYVEAKNNIMLIGNRENSPEMLFLEALILQETGQDELAANLFQLIIYQFPQNDYAGYAKNILLEE